MEEYRTECYIVGKNETPVLIENYFRDKDDYDKWRKKAEKSALESFYNKKIILR